MQFLLFAASHRSILKEILRAARCLLTISRRQSTYVCNNLHDWNAESASKILRIQGAAMEKVYSNTSGFESTKLSCQKRMHLFPLLGWTFRDDFAGWYGKNTGIMGVFIVSIGFWNDQGLVKQRNAKTITEAPWKGYVTLCSLRCFLLMFHAKQKITPRVNLD